MSRLLTSEEAKDFADIIKAYKPSDELLERFQASNFVVIAGSAGAGKDTLRNSLVASFPEVYIPILSTTTRPPRPGEIDGQVYHFDTTTVIHELLTKREVLQVALVHNQQLSVLRSKEIYKLTPDQYGLSILIVQTEMELRAYNQSMKTIFVTAPDYQTLLARLKAERTLGGAEIKRRLEAAKSEVKQALGSAHYYCLVSDTVKSISSEAHNYIKTGVRNESEDARARLAMKEILSSLGN